ncbi:hypothetical protein GO730_10785 [Spirosoma sp. HMF3257]|uniref:Lipocalin-like domain-containing protein n=1 Tax=Spirosoma telluris TaxID=2183553 RepID=A0A327NIF2_9BACT|nr:hypothetical protein [Spirosoma telluris]RAI74623.1 hypothetical protein HMF3257_10715 [Spirosoma telluris]
MKHFVCCLIVVVLLASHQLIGQTISGTWVGSLVSTTNSSVSLQSSLTWRASGQQLVGELRVGAGGKEDQYQLNGITANQQAQGTATYPIDGSVFQFEAALQNEQLLLKLGQNGNVTISGILTRSGSISKARPSTLAPSADDLYRDPALIGAWRTSSNYGGGTTDGGFYGSTSSTMILRADGTFGDGGSSGYASGSGVSVQSSGGGDAALYTKLAAAGARWFTKGNLFCVRLRVNGQMQDVPSSKYYVENGKLLITDLKSGKKTLYYKAN